MTADPRPLAATHSDVPGVQTGSQGVRPELVEAGAAKAYMVWFPDDDPPEDERWENLPFYDPDREQAIDTTAAALAAVLPLLTPEDVPHIEAAVRAKVAEEIDAACEREAPMYPTFPPRDGGLRAAAYRRGMSYAADLARGGQDGGR